MGIKIKPGILVTRDQQTNNATQYDKMIVINNAAHIPIHKYFQKLRTRLLYIENHFPTSYMIQC